MRAMVRVRRRSRSSPAAARLSLARATTQRRPFLRSTRARKPETVTRVVPGGGGEGEAVAEGVVVAVEAAPVAAGPAEAAAGARHRHRRDLS